MMENNKQDRFDVDLGARKLAIDTVLRALIDHASATDPGLRDRILAAVGTYIARVEPQSELENDFADRAKLHVAALLQSPTE